MLTMNCPISGPNRCHLWPPSCHPGDKDITQTLAEKKCTPCRGGVAPLTHEEAERFRSQTPNWELRDDGHRIERTFRFSNFREALGFVADVGDLAETEGHHPDISFGWGYATISLRTKKIKGLQNDFIMASKIDRIFARSNDPPDISEMGTPAMTAAGDCVVTIFGGKLSSSRALS